MTSSLKPRFSVDLKANIGEISLLPRGRYFGAYLYRESGGKLSKRELVVLDEGGDVVSRWGFPDEVFSLGFAGDRVLAVMHSDLDAKPHTLTVSGFDFSGNRRWTYPYPGSADFLYFDVVLDEPPRLLVDSMDNVLCHRGVEEVWRRGFRRSRVRSLTGVLARNPMNLKGVWNLQLLEDGGAMVLTPKLLYRIGPDGGVAWEKKLDAPYKMLSADTEHVLISSDGYYARKPEQTVLLTGEGEELWRRSLPLPLAAMGWSPHDGVAALALYTEPEDGGLTFINSSGNDLATHEVHGWPRGMSFARNLAMLACEGEFYAFDGRGTLLGHLPVGGLESFCASGDGLVMAVGATQTLHCWER